MEGVKVSQERSAVTPPMIEESRPVFDPIIQSYIRHLRAENKSEATIAAYTYAAEGLGSFILWAGMPYAYAAIRREHVEAYIENLLATRAPATAHMHYRGLRQWFNWLREEGEITESPMIHMKPPILPEKPVPVLEVASLKKLLADCDATFDGRRDEAILRVFIDSGARLAEVAGLRLLSEDGGDVDLDGGVLRVLGKGRRSRLVPIGPKAARAVDRYLRKRTQHHHAALPNLWIGKKGPMTGSGIRQMVWKRSTAAGIGRIYPPRLRHPSTHRWPEAGGSEGTS